MKSLKACAIESVSRFYVLLIRFIIYREKNINIIAINFMPSIFIFLIFSTDYISRKKLKSAKTIKTNSLKVHSFKYFKHVILHEVRLLR